MDQAEQLGIVRMAAEGILLSHLLLGSPLPEPVHFHIQRDKGISRIAGKSFYLMNHAAGPPHKPFTPSFFWSESHRAMLRSDLRYKLTYWGDMLSVDYGDWEKVPLPDGCFPLYYFLRPFLWFFK